MSPFECSLGTRQQTEVAVPSAREHLCQCCRMWRSAHTALLWANDRSQHPSNWCRIPALVYRRGQPVWLLAKDLPIPTCSHKLGPCYVGTYIVERIINPTAVRLSLPSSLQFHPVFHVSKLKSVAVSALSPPVTAPPPPRVPQDGDPVWPVWKLLHVRRRGRGFQFLVDWEGYDPEDRS